MSHRGETRMKVCRLLLALLLGLAAAAGARAAGTEGDLYLLGVALDQTGEPEIGRAHV